MRSRLFLLLSGLAAFVVIWLLGFAPQFLFYVHASWIIVFFLEGALSAVAFIAYVRLIEKREPTELSAWQWHLLPLGTLIGGAFFALLIGMLAVSGHYRFESYELPSRFVTAIVFALGTSIWEEATFRGCSSAPLNARLERGWAWRSQRSWSLMFNLPRKATVSLFSPFVADLAATFALYLRSVCVLNTAFRSLRCHPLTCMLLKLR